MAPVVCWIQSRLRQSGPLPLLMGRLHMCPSGTGRCLQTNRQNIAALAIRHRLVRWRLASGSHMSLVRAWHLLLLLVSGGGRGSRRR